MYHFTGGTVYLEDGFKTGIDVLTDGKRIGQVGPRLAGANAKTVKLRSGQFLLPE